jgi:hypothetical protein
MLLLVLLLVATCCSGASYGQTLPIPANFVEFIDNPYFPLPPGTTFIYSGPTAEEGPQLLQITVTHQKKMILGVNTTVVIETLNKDGILNEVSTNWFAQDKWGNVWYFGEASKLYQDGQVYSTEGSWEAGVDGAQPGVIMEGRPRIGDFYNQEIAPGVAQDQALVLSLNNHIKVPYGNFNKCLLTKESSPLDPGLFEYKYYARGIGFILGIDTDGLPLKLFDVISSDDRMIH